MHEIVPPNFVFRTSNRGEQWTDVMRKLDKEAQVLLAQRLGYFQVCILWARFGTEG